MIATIRKMAKTNGSQRFGPTDVKSVLIRRQEMARPVTENAFARHKARGALEKVLADLSPSFSKTMLAKAEHACQMYVTLVGDGRLRDIGRNRRIQI